MNKFNMIYLMVAVASMLGVTVSESSGDLIDCPDELNTSNFTERIWDKYCMETKTDADYNGTGLK